MNQQKKFNGDPFVQKRIGTAPTQGTEKQNQLLVFNAKAVKINRNYVDSKPYVGNARFNSSAGQNGNKQPYSNIIGPTKMS
jgi:hypothetical protein